MKTAIIDERIPVDIERDLESRGFKIIKLPMDRRLGAGVLSHTDMLLFHHGSTLIGSGAYFEEHSDVLSKIRESLPSFNIVLTDDVFEKSYPKDAVFNAKVIGNKILMKADTVSAGVKTYAEEAGLEIINTRQGYPACVCLALSDDLCITSDRGVADLLTRASIKVITVPESEAIVLPPFKNGFIGGCGTVFEDTLYFLGDAHALPYYNIIEEAATGLGLCIAELGQRCGKLFDLGGVILADA